MDRFINYGTNNNRGFLFWRTLIRKGEKWQKVIHLYLEAMEVKKEGACIARMLAGLKMLIKNAIEDKEDNFYYGKKFISW